MTEKDWHPLAAHSLDTMNVADRLWDGYLSPAFRRRLAVGLPGGPEQRDQLARGLFRWLAALHDLGKCTPGFQQRSDLHFPRVKALLPVAKAPEHRAHNLVSAHLLYRFARESGWEVRAAKWAAAVVGGHHGVFPAPDLLHAESAFGESEIGGGEWRRAQRELFDRLTEASGVRLDLLAGHVPPIGAQMACAGAVILADWLASNEGLFGYANKGSEDYPEASRRTSSGFAATMQLGDVWRPEPEPDAHAHYRSRFGIGTPRDTQVVAYDIAASMERPGLMVIEAPTGEGKTEAALAAAEVMAARSGANGLFFALPTQATGNQIFDRVLDDWVTRLPQGTPPTVGLVHGKAARHEKFHDLPLAGVGEHGQDAVTASQWMRGGKKALLSPVSVGTIDQLLFAGVSAPHVMLRHTALAGKAVVVDEVHAYDTYMAQILHRVLRWLGLHGVPVILLSATLPPAARAALVDAYAPGADGTVDAGYPQVTWVESADPAEPAPAESFFAPSVEEASAPRVGVRAAERTEERAADLAVEFFPEGEGPLPLARRIADLTADGGCALAVRNTVGRAQELYDGLVGLFGAEQVTLVHSRFTADDRNRLDASLRERFGPPKKDEETGDAIELPGRPSRHVVVATQVAEQSLDVDFDLVASDMAPVDLLLQRAGRLHRHRRPKPRPEALREPKLIVAGFSIGAEAAPPRYPTKDDRPYLHHLLLRTHAALMAAAGEQKRATGPVLRIPQDVPGLIDTVYGEDEIGPPGWEAAMKEARAGALSAFDDLRRHARALLLKEPDASDPDLGALCRATAHEADEEERGHLLRVRSGPMSVEAVLLRRAGTAVARTVSAGGKVDVPLDRTPNRRQKEAVLGQTVRLPKWMVDTDALECPPGWKNAPWARGLRVLLLGRTSGTVRHGKKTLGYDPERGISA
ncbi:CRISPR-associated helicase Cas3' [Nocardiopsis sp. CNT-189]